MAKSSPVFTCQTCGAVHRKWAGRCDACGAWNSIVEETPLSSGPKALGSKGRTIALSDLATEEAAPPRTSSGIDELDRVLGGGLVPASAILVGGDPGIGKSTLLLQAAASFANGGVKCLYISGEEAAAQVRMRAQRLGLGQAPVALGAETNLRDILTTLDAERPALAIIDSIQTMWLDNVESAPGSVAQVRASAHELVTFAKRRGVAIVIVGHVTKEGQIAGPRVVEHMVDTVLYFEGERGHQFRILRAVKNRFGPADEIGVFEMTGGGLAQVANPSALFLSDRDQPAPGSAVFAGIEGTRPVLTEIQALVSPSPLGTPRRTVVGLDSGRLSTILAVLEARCGIPLRGPRCFPQRGGRDARLRACGRPRRGRGPRLGPRRCGNSARHGAFRRDLPLGCPPPGGPDRKPLERGLETWFLAGNRADPLESGSGRGNAGASDARPRGIRG